MKSSNKDKTLETPVIFWSSIGVAISTSIVTIMKFSTLFVVITIIAGLLLGMTVGYFSKAKSETNIAENELTEAQNLKRWWQHLTKLEKSALTMLGFIFMLIMLFTSGSIIGQYL
jgi:uncharacterized membrane protein